MTSTFALTFSRVTEHQIWSNTAPPQSDPLFCIWRLVHMFAAPSHNFPSHGREYRLPTSGLHLAAVGAREAEKIKNFPKNVSQIPSIFLARFSIFATRCYASAAYAVIRCPSVRPSALSVTLVNSFEMNKHIFKKFSPSGSHTILVFPYQTSWQYSDGKHRWHTMRSLQFISCSIKVW